MTLTEIITETVQTSPDTKTVTTAAAPETIITRASETIQYEKPQFKYDWQELYYNELSELITPPFVMPNTPMFNIYDLDKNGVPELMLSHGLFHMAFCYIYTVENGELIKLGEYGENGEFSFDSENKLIYDKYYGWGNGMLKVYKYENGYTEEIISFNSSLDTGIYEINGEEVLEDTYIEEYKKYNFISEYEEFPGVYIRNDFGSIDYFLNRENVTEEAFYTARENYFEETEGMFHVRRYVTSPREVLYAFNKINELY